MNSLSMSFSQKPHNQPQTQKAHKNIETSPPITTQPASVIVKYKESWLPASVQNVSKVVWIYGASGIIAQTQV